MKPDNHSEAQRWLKRAYSNLILAQQGEQDGVLLEDLCFNAQQATEKALKAICVLESLDFPKTHSLIRLLDIIAAGGIVVPTEVKQCDILTQYAVQARYPGPIEPVTAEEHQAVTALAAQTVFWDEKYVAGKAQV